VARIGVEEGGEVTAAAETEAVVVVFATGGGVM
jgi:hypothetical protein